MQGEDMRSPVEQDQAMDAAVMGLLLDPRFHLWKISEVQREIGDEVAVRDSLNRLRGAGLVHETALPGVRDADAGPLLLLTSCRSERRGTVRQTLCPPACAGGPLPHAPGARAEAN
jgi:hypothetical protein